MTGPALPVALQSHKMLPAAASLKGDLSALTSVTLLPFEEAFTTEHPTDAHFVCYCLVDGRGAPADFFPRLKKCVLGEIRETGWDVQTSLLVLEYDNPGHADWTPESLRLFLERCDAVSDTVVGKWAVFYTTKRGARWVFRLERPVPSDESERRWLALLGKFHALGIMAASDTKDWTRFWRLPKVVRDGRETAHEDYFLMAIRPDVFLPLDEVPPAGPEPEPAASVVKLEEDQPTPEEAEALLWVGTKRSEWWNEARRWLKGRESWPCIFEAAPIAREGERNPTIMRYAGQVVSLLFARPGTTAQRCYALLAPAVQQLEGADGGRAWLDTLWHGIRHAWEREAGKAEAASREKALAEAGADPVSAHLLVGVREWARPLVPPEIYDDPAALRAWVTDHHAIASVNSGHYFVIRPDGYFDRYAVGSDLLKAHIEKLGTDRILDYWFSNEDGKVCSTTVPELLRRYGFRVARLIGRAGKSGGALVPAGDGKIALSMGLYRLRDDLAPAYDKDVDEWLHALTFGRPSDAKRLMDWISHALDFSAPICALSFVGPPGCGKKLLARGLAECITTRALASGDDMISGFNSGLLRSPFVVVNEGISRALGQDPADVFRRWIGGDGLECNEKYQPKIEIQAPLRVILTANNGDVVRSLASARTLTPEDRDAIAIRIMHIEASTAAGRWLEAKGGLSFTSGWIDRDDGERGEERVARHFMWLHQHRDPMPAGNRFLVQGEPDQDVLQEIAGESGCLLDVIESVVGLVETTTKFAKAGLHTDVDTGAVYVTTDGVLQFWQKHIAQFRKGRGSGMHHLSVGKALQGLVERGWSSKNKMRLDDDASGHPKLARWHKIDTQRVAAAAIKYGMPCDRLLSLLANERRYLSGVTGTEEDEA